MLQMMHKILNFAHALHGNTTFSDEGFWITSTIIFDTHMEHMGFPLPPEGVHIVVECLRSAQAESTNDPEFIWSLAEQLHYMHEVLLGRPAEATMQ